MKQKLVATTLFGLERMLGEEIDALGYERIETIDGRITFEGDEKAVARSNVFLSQCEHIYIRVGEFPATSFTELFDGVTSLPWEEYIGENDEFPVNGHAIKSTLYSVPDCQSIIKKAIVERLKKTYKRESFPEDDGLRVRIEFFIFKDRATLMIDTSGAPLHKRGYRKEANLAPIRETLAMALVKTAHLREGTLLWDPFCGSGTIAIEAARAACNIAPGMKRRFAGEDYFFVDEDSWSEAREEAKSLVNLSADFEAYASDIDPETLEIAKENARRAGVLDKIKFFEKDARKIYKPNCRGTIICNPPYGERMMSEEEVKLLYRDIGRTFEKFDPWQIYIITGYSDFEYQYGRQADKKRKLYNGMIPCTLYEYYKPRHAREDSYRRKDFRNSGDFKRDGFYKDFAPRKDFKKESNPKKDFKKFDK